MSGDARLLVVDDEAVICQACQRVFTRQGFQVETSTDARTGLNEALTNDYSAVLLDIKMPEMDGIQFLEALRQQKPDIPVMIMTGYPSIPNAASAVRLGAADYVTKPFTPEQITQSVRRMLRRDSAKAGAAETGEEPETREPRPEGFFFFDESWVQLEIDGSALVGALVKRPGKTVREIRLPDEGETLYQGLPLAGVTFEDGTRQVIPCPISGVVVSTNGRLVEDPGALFEDPFGAGWIACVCSTRLEEEDSRLTTRRIVLVNFDDTSVVSQRERLAALGCRTTVADSEELLVSLAGHDQNQVFLFDADSLGAGGPEFVGKLRAAGYAPKIIVTATADQRWETAYRDKGIFYYAVDPFTDDEIVEILDAAFRSPPQPALVAGHPRQASKSLHTVRATNRNGHKVQLLAGPKLLSRYEGLGAAIMGRLMEEYVPVETSFSDTEITPNVVLDAARTCDRVMVLQAQDRGRLPGSMARDTKAEYVSASRENASRATTLVVQPDESGCGFSGLDRRTIAALAEHIASEMMSY